VDGVGAADRAGAGLGQADVADLALGDQFGQGAGGLLDRRARVDPVLSVTPGPPPEWETRPNFVATTTWSRRPLIASPISSSLWNGP
jgi:hypothetical protein